MAHSGTLRDFRFHDDVNDLRGAELYGRDDKKLGKVDDVIFDHSSGRIQYLVIDAGWLSTKKFMVPAERIHQRAGHDDDLACDFTEDQIKSFPEYNDKHVSDEHAWGDYRALYDKAIESDGGVLHRAGSDHLITPDASEMPIAGSGGAVEPNVDFTPSRIAGTFTNPDPTSGKNTMRPAGIAARAEDSKKPGSALHNESTAWEESDPQRASVGRRDSDPLASGGTVNDFSPREDIGDVDVDTARPQSSSSAYGAYGTEDEIDVPEHAQRDPLAYRNTVGEPIGHPRLRTFEEHLRRNRVDITSSCRSCDVKKDRAA